MAGNRLLDMFSPAAQEAQANLLSKYLGLPAGGLRRSVIDDVTGRAVTSPAREPSAAEIGGAYLDLIATRARDAVTAPRDAYRGDFRVFDPVTGHVSDEAMDRANGMAGLAMTGGFGGAPRGALGSGPARHFDIGDKFSVLAKDVGEGGRNYEIRARGFDDPIGHAQLTQRPDGRWETGTIQVAPEHRGQGAASALYKAVEQDTGHPRVPSGSLLEDGYRFWQARDPEAVQYHQHVGEGIYLSPRRLMELMETAPTPADRAMGQAILDRVPAAGRTPEALARQFAVPMLLGGGAAAASMTQSGEAQANALTPFMAPSAR